MLKRETHRLSKPHFNLRDKHSSKETPIFLYYKFNPGLPRLKYSIKETVNPKYWNQDNHRVKVSLNYPKHLQLNERLNDIENHAVKTKRENPDITIDQFKTELDYFLGFAERPKPAKPPSLLEFLDQYLEEGKTKMNYRTYQKHQGVVNHLRAFSDAQFEGKLNYDDIDLKFKDDFANWLFEKHNHSQNTLNKIIQTVKLFMRLSHERRMRLEDGSYIRYHANDIFNDRRFKVSRIKTSKHPLTSKELEHLYNFDLSDNPKLSRVRDYFCFMCYSGLRVSDLFRLSRDNVIKDNDENEYLQVFTFKGRNTKLDNECLIPYTAELNDIFSKYSYSFPRISEQKLNDYIKDLGELAKLNRSVINKSGVKDSQPESKALWQTLSNHSGRYTYISVMINEKGVAPQDLMNVTGQSLKTLMGYVRGDKKEVVKRVASKLK